MGDNAALQTLARQLRSGRIDRRKFMQGAAALGVSATAISSALRIAPTRAQDAGTVTFWTTYVANDLDNVQAVVDGYNAQSTAGQVELVQIPTRPGDRRDHAHDSGARRDGP